ncbi:MAG: hypothetical protein F6J93_23425 [Oscillatoria sp. SIO1A7]|nr:hypothetical protein [Oscillatoria sp. SIO1A7]
MTYYEIHARLEKKLPGIAPLHRETIGADPVTSLVVGQFDLEAFRAAFRRSLNQRLD